MIGRGIKGINTVKLIIFMFIAVYMGLNIGVANTANAQMYVPNFGNSTISQANLDGTGGVSLGNLNGTLNGTEGIALDLTAGKMYVPNFGNSIISQANLDGTGGVSLGNLNGTLNSPIGIALDLTAGKMYVTNNGTYTISQANLDGTGGVSLGNLNGTLNGPSGIALFDGTPTCTSDADCDDGQFCNGTETCDIGTGNCVAVSACPPAIDGCVTRNASCDELNDVCVDFADDSLCDDGLFCNGTETCELATGNCVAVSACPPAIDGCVTRNASCDQLNDVCVDFADDSLCGDSISCTDDSCNLATGLCENDPNNALCSPGEVCDVSFGGCTVSGAGPVTSVPTLSQWGMIIFIFLAGLVAIFSLRRRNIE
jgi:hypothetical protein